MTAIGILGGTFDPIHFGHLAIAEEARVALGLARVLFVPAAHQPLKAYRPAAAPHQRLAMVGLACASNPAFEPSDIEIVRPGPSYTINSLRDLAAREPAELHFILGADALLDLPRWRAADQIPTLARIVAVQRPHAPVHLDELLAKVPALSGRLVLLDGPNLDISSSELRQRIASGHPVRYLTPDPVVDYIEEHQLYRTNIEQDGPADQHCR